MNISGLDKAEVLVALWNASHQQGRGFLHDDSMGLLLDEARELLVAPGRVDHVKGRVMKIDLHPNEVWTDLYNRDNYEGAAEDVVLKLRERQ